MTKPAANDDFDAVRQLVEALTPFEEKDRSRIIRWACEKMGMPSGSDSGLGKLNDSFRQQIPPTLPLSNGGITHGRDLKSFVQEKSPSNDLQFVAVVAYYYLFESPEEQRKEVIRANDLIEACRIAVRNRPLRPDQTMVNTYNAGYVDKVGSGKYRLNAVGENLVVMVLPGKETESVNRKPRSRNVKKKIRKSSMQKRKTKK